MIDVVEIVPEKPAIGKAFKKEGKMVMDYLAQMDKDSIKEFEDKLSGNGWVLKHTRSAKSGFHLGAEKEFVLHQLTLRDWLKKLTPLFHPIRSTLIL